MKKESTQHKNKERVLWWTKPTNEPQSFCRVKERQRTVREKERWSESENKIKLKPEVLCLYSACSFLFVAMFFLLFCFFPFQYKQTFYVRFYAYKRARARPRWSRWLTNRRPWKLSRLCLWMNNTLWIVSVEHCRCI